MQSQQIELSDIQRKMQRQYKTGESNEKAISKLYGDIEKAINKTPKEEEKDRETHQNTLVDFYEKKVKDHPSDEDLENY